jgi:hypothetical protein
MERKILLSVLLMMSAIPVTVVAHAGQGNMVDVRIVSDSGVEFATYRSDLRVCQAGDFFYLEAVKGGRYSIQVTNTSGRRIGVVIAVDGRNIIDGKKSDLKRNERMYVIGPYGSSTFEGWRTGLDRTNRFYFTAQSDSYAEKVFGDGSAMGTIALNVYRERLPEITPYSDRPPRMKEAPSGAEPSAPRESRSTDRAERKQGEEAGTGFGPTTYSPAQVVHFEPEYAPAQRIVLKYEWRSDLCRKGIIRCGPKNRFWPDEDGFAPIPRGFSPVVSFTPGTYLFGSEPPASSDAFKTLGAPGGQPVPLGLGGQITLEFVDTVVIDGPGDDLQINAFSPGSGSQELDNRAEVLVSADGVSFVSLGTIGPGGPSFSKDLSGTGLTQIRFVRIVDSGSCCLSGNPQGGGDGFNVESVEALNSGSGKK